MEQATASFTSTDEGYRQDFEFTERGVFSSTVLPLGAPVGGVLICPSLFTDLYRNCRNEVLLARRLARLGVAVERFHYRGTGNSTGDGNLTWESLVEDARDAQARLVHRIGDELPTGVMAARFGSLIAAALGTGRPDVPLALWEPIPVATTYARDLKRVERMAKMTSPDGVAADAVARLMPSSLTAVAAELSIAALAAAGLGDVLVVRGGRVPEKSVDGDVIDALRAVATSVKVRDYPDEVLWWSRTRVALCGPMDRLPMLDDTATWLRHALTSRA